MNKRIANWAVVLGMCCAWCMKAGAQPTSMRINLQDAMEIAKRQSLESLAAHNTMRISYWQYRNFKADLSPNMTLDGTLPSLNRSLTSYQKPDGSYEFLSSNYISENIGLTISQSLPFSGGKVYVQSQLERLDQLDGTRKGSFLSVPATLTLSQPIFALNTMKWAKKIEPIRYEEAQKQYAVAMEEVNRTTIRYYFDLLLSMANQSIARQNYENAQKLCEIARSKQQLGLISDNDLKQLKLGELNAAASVIVADQDYTQKMHTLRNFLGYNDAIIIELNIPEECPSIAIDPDLIMKMATENNPVFSGFKRRLLEAERNIAQAKADRGFRMDVYASLGFTGSNVGLGPAYQNLKNRQIVEVGVSIPILDWGRGKGRVEMAKSQSKLVEGQIQREQNDFEESIRALVQQLQDQRSLVDIYRQADSIANTRYQIALETFSLGTISILDINAAQNEKDTARRNYINQLYYSWIYYYTLRYITLYDFQKQQNIQYDLEN